MDKYLSSDLACEKFDSKFRESEEGEYDEEYVGDFKIVRLSRLEGETQQNYITVECGRIWELDEAQQEDLCRILEDCIRELSLKISQKEINKDFSVLIAGLGNSDITVDAIGPECIKRITATRHLRAYDETMFEAVGCCEVSAIATGVLGQTGVESVDVIKGILGEAQVDLVIVIDALAARSCERLASTFQISDTGIDPGAGIGNHRKKIDADVIGVPILAIGVPTVVNSSALMCDALKMAGIDTIDGELELALESARSFYVAPKESDIITERVAGILARSIGMVFSQAFV